MKILYRKFYAVILLIINMIFMGCSQELELSKQTPVIEGWIDSEGYPVILFSESLVPDKSGGTISDKVIRWGKVSVSDGYNEIILTGGPNKNYIPPYIYTTYRMKGEVGKKYKIVADYEDFHIESECLMPEPTPIKAVELSHVENNDNVRSAKLVFVSPQKCPAYYYITVTSLNDGYRRPLPAMMSTYKASEPGKEISIPLFRPKNKLSSESYLANFIVGEVIEIKLCSISEDVYEFWKDYDNAVLFGGSQFVNSAQSLKGNINGGFGIWSAQGVSSRTIEIK